MELELKGKTAIVTGGSRGIGKAVGREFGLEGMDVALVARGQEALEATARELAEETGANFITIVADTGDPESVKAMVKEAAEKLGRIDILVNSAARVSGAYAPKLADITEDDFWSDMNVKVMGYLRCAQAVAPHMIDEGWGRIINLSGMAARRAGYSVGSMRNVSVAAVPGVLARRDPHPVAAASHPCLYLQDGMERLRGWGRMGCERHGGPPAYRYNDFAGSCGTVPTNYNLLVGW